MIETKSNQPKINRLFIIIESIAIIVLIALVINVTVFSRAVEFDVSNLPLWSQNEGMYYKIENAEEKNQDGKDYFIIKGYIIEKYVPSKASDTIKVVLKDISTNKYFVVPTTKQVRSNITRQNYDGTNYDNCGFEAKVENGDKINLSSGKYEVYVFVKNSNGKKIVYSGYNVNA